MLRFDFQTMLLDIYIYGLELTHNFLPFITTEKIFIINSTSVFNIILYIL